MTVDVTMKHYFAYIFLLLLLSSNIACYKDDDIILEKETIMWNDAIPDDGEDENTNSYTYKFVGAEKFLDLNQTTSGAQGSACYGDYFFQGYNTNSHMDVYNLKTGKYICRIQISIPQKSTRYHVNTINFGNQFYNENDKFPVLYVCSGYTKDTSSSKSYVFVYRILEEDECFKLELIQTITLDFGSWTEAILDNDHNAIWIKSSPSICRKFQVPLISKGECNISLNEGVLKEFNYGPQSFTSHDQGHLYYDDRILLATGVPSWNEKIALVVINTLTGKMEAVVDLYDLGLFDASNPQNNDFEPEGVIVYENEIMICYRNAIYKLIRDEK